MATAECVGLGRRPFSCAREHLFRTLRLKRRPPRSPQAPSVGRLATARMTEKPGAIIRASSLGVDSPITQPSPGPLVFRGLEPATSSVPTTAEKQQHQHNDD